MERAGVRRPGAAAAWRVARTRVAFLFRRARRARAPSRLPTHARAPTTALPGTCKTHVRGVGVGGRGGRGGGNRRRRKKRGSPLSRSCECESQGVRYFFFGPTLAQGGGGGVGVGEGLAPGAHTPRLPRVVLVRARAFGRQLAPGAADICRLPLLIARPRLGPAWAWVRARGGRDPPRPPRPERSSRGGGGSAGPRGRTRAAWTGVEGGEGVGVRGRGAGVHVGRGTGEAP